MDREEQDILRYFFTNTDENIFVAKNFHPEVWALMQARYSRSVEGLREGFIKLLKEDPENFAAMAQAIRSGDQVQMESAVEKAIQFMERWVLGYGHSSVAEGAVIGICLEDVSILATKVIEDNRLGSFIEKSTRYVSFDEDSFYLDPVLMGSKYGDEVKAVITHLFETYKRLHAPVLEYIKKSVPCPEDQSEKAWDRSCAARRFDAVRYLLPACTKTSLGWTVNARQLAHGIKKLLSNPLAEMQDIGKAVKKEGQKALPSLLLYAEENTYLQDTEQDMQELGSGMFGQPTQSTEDVALVDATEDPDVMLAASILYRYSGQPMEACLQKGKAMSAEERESVIDAYLGKMGKFDWPMRALENIDFLWDVTMDYGAFRDLQRHRICTQIVQPLTTFLGYSTPPDIIGASVQKEYDEAMERARVLFEKLYAEYPEQAQYIVPLGYRMRYLFKANLREMFHLIKLRTTPQGHFSYRIIGKKMHEILAQRYPLLAKHIVCSLDDDELGRLKQESVVQRKMDEGRSLKDMLKE